MLDRPRLDICDETYLLQSCAMGIKKQTNKLHLATRDMFHSRQDIFLFLKF